MPKAKTTAAKKATTAKKAPAKKPAKKSANAATIKSSIVLQYGEKSVPYDDLVSRIKEIWTGTYQKKLIDINTVDLYIKPEENKVYYVVNNDTQGDFDL